MHFQGLCLKCSRIVDVDVVDVDVVGVVDVDVVDVDVVDVDVVAVAVARPTVDGGGGLEGLEATTAGTVDNAVVVRFGRGCVGAGALATQQ